MAGPKTVEEQILRILDGLDAEERELTDPELAVVLIAKLREPALYKLIRTMLE